MIRRFPADKYPDLYLFFPSENSPTTKSNSQTVTHWSMERLGQMGLKTGHTEDPGYGLVGSAVRNGQRVVMVLNGMTASNSVQRGSRRLMDLIFREYQSYEFFNKVNQSIEQTYG